MEPSEDDCPRAHGAGLEGYVERTIIETPAFQHRACFSNRQHLGMRCRVLIANRSIIGSRNNRVPPNDDRPDRDFILPSSVMPNRDCVAHELLIDLAPRYLRANEPFDISHESRRGRSSRKIDERKLAIRPRIDLDLVALEETPFEHQKCQWILDEALNRSLQRTRAERLIVTLRR